MADFNQFGSATPPQSGDAHHCAQCEAMLADALDGTLSAQDQATFDLHMAACTSCAGMLRDAERGMAWMEMLKSAPPEPSAALLDRIFAETTDKAAAEAHVSRAAREQRRQATTLLGHPIASASHSGESQPVAAFSGNVIPFRTRFAHGLRSLGQTMLQPRLAMTAAMAFFSIALTMNLTGIRLSNLRASDFRPSSILRSCYSAKARVVRYSDNLRVVYELESRVRDLQHSDEDFTTNTPAPQNAPASAKPGQSPSGTQAAPNGQTPGQQNQNPKDNEDKQSRPKPGPGSSRRETPGGKLMFIGSMHRRGTESASMQNFAVFFPRIEDEGGLV